RRNRASLRLNELAALGWTTIKLGPRSVRGTSRRYREYPVRGRFLSERLPGTSVCFAVLSAQEQTGSLRPGRDSFAPISVAPGMFVASRKRTLGQHTLSAGMCQLRTHALQIRGRAEGNLEPFTQIARAAFPFGLPPRVPHSALPYAPPRVTRISGRRYQC